MLVVAGGSVVSIIKLALVLPVAAGANWIDTAWVFPGAIENGIGPFCKVNDAAGSNCCTVPLSIPLPEFRSKTVLVALAPAWAAIAIALGATNRPGSTTPLTATFTN